MKPIKPLTVSEVDTENGTIYLWAQVEIVPNPYIILRPVTVMKKEVIDRHGRKGISYELGKVFAGRDEYKALDPGPLVAKSEIDISNMPHNEYGPINQMIGIFPSEWHSRLISVQSAYMGGRVSWYYATYPYLNRLFSLSDAEALKEIAQTQDVARYLELIGLSPKEFYERVKRKKRRLSEIEKRRNAKK